MNLTLLNFEESIQESDLYNKIRETVKFGNAYRLLSPFEGNEVAWMNISKDRSQVVVSYVKQFAEPNMWNKPLKLKGLDSDALYEIDGTKYVLGGDELMNIGLVIPELKGDYAASQWILNRIK